MITSNYYIEVRYCHDCKCILLEWKRIMEYQAVESVAVRALPDGSCEYGEPENKAYLHIAHRYTCVNSDNHRISKIYIRARTLQWLRQMVGNCIFCELSEDEVHDGHISIDTIKQRLLENVITS